MTSQITKRRRALIENYVKTFSLKTAVETVSKRYRVNEAALRVDWQRRKNWPKEVFERLNDFLPTQAYLMAIHRTLAQIENELEKTTNSSCQVGLIKLKIETLFKLYEIQKSNDYQVLLKRIEPMEKRLEFLESQRQKDEGKLK